MEILTIIGCVFTIYMVFVAGAPISCILLVLVGTIIPLLCSINGMNMKG